MNIESYKNCFITPSGKVHKCRYGEHEFLLDTMNITLRNIELGGWIRVSNGIAYYRFDMTKNQLKIIEKYNLSPIPVNLNQNQKIFFESQYN